MRKRAAVENVIKRKWQPAAPGRPKPLACGGPLPILQSAGLPARTGRTFHSPADPAFGKVRLPLGAGIAVMHAMARFPSTVRVVRMGVRVMGGTMGQPAWHQNDRKPPATQTQEVRARPQPKPANCLAGFFFFATWRRAQPMGPGLRPYLRVRPVSRSCPATCDVPGKPSGYWINRASGRRRCACQR